MTNIFKPTKLLSRTKFGYKFPPILIDHMTPSATVSMKKKTNRNTELKKIIDKYYFRPLESIILVDGGTSVLAFTIHKSKMQLKCRKM